MIHKLTIDMLPTVNIVFIYGKKKYERYLQNYGIKMTMTAEVTELTNSSGQDLVIGTRKLKDPVRLKAMIVHEISHAVTFIMERHGINDDEFRSYAMQYIYKEIIGELDKVLIAKYEKRKKK